MLRTYESSHAKRGLLIFTNTIKWIWIFSIKHAASTALLFELENYPLRERAEVPFISELADPSINLWVSPLDGWSPAKCTFGMTLIKACLSVAWLICCCCTIWLTIPSPPLSTINCHQSIYTASSYWLLWKDCKLMQQYNTCILQLLF